ncbi:hypothetical protein B0H66DRAFT_608274 [Apodospora peruviana]|uniref:Uncharacterized protein n=1 Tax=Apodospora peruviana TaxID=516989 RepID=A0AAE0HUZ6_9PEZI|nr:hypothetical protein B0H66DRAFT_608274 [Apodospora peruviana]
MANRQAAEGYIGLVEPGITAIKGLIPVIWLQSKTSPIQFLLVCAVTFIISFLFTSIKPPHESAEPPLIKPGFPVVGHIWGLLRKQVIYFIMAALLLGFEIVGLDADKLRMGDSKRGETAKALPGLAGGPVVIRRRQGSEEVTWKFSC